MRNVVWFFISMMSIVVWSCTSQIKKESKHEKTKR